MTKKFLILGGGQQGCEVARLLKANVGCDVTVADINKHLNLSSKDIKTEYFNAKDVLGNYRNILGKWMSSFDVVAGCLPSHFGADCVHLAAEFGINYIDLSFADEDLLKFDQLAKISGATIIPDCGLAPGMPNLVVGHFMSSLKPGEKLGPVEIYVGGNAKDPNLPYGYVETWSLEDLYEEYTRPGRFVCNGEDMRTEPLDLERLETVQIGGVVYEAFTSDGLRTLLNYKSIVPSMKEYTLRYPGHMEKIKELFNSLSFQGEPVAKDDFVKHFRSFLSKGEDEVVLRVASEGRKSVELKVQGNEKISAMAQTTAGMCASMVSWLSDQVIRRSLDAKKHVPSGVVPLEYVGFKHFNSVSRFLKNVGGLYLYR